LPNTNTPFWAKIRLLLLKLLSINCNLSHSEKIQEQFQDYHENLIKDAKSYHYHKEKLSNLELLLELQHYGAATGSAVFL
jgi:hypothetical protein